MKIDRRELVTGVAATTAAASVSAFAIPLRQGFGGREASADAPALPAHGASFKGRRFYFPEGLLFSLAIPWSLASNRAHYESRWHFDPNPKGHALIQHEGSGLTFRRRPQAGNPFVMEAFFIDGTLEGWPDAERLTAVGRAAVFAFVQGQNLRYWGRRKGAFYFRDRPRKTAGDDYTPPYVEDAPALS
jgi:hypothetical protein